MIDEYPNSKPFHKIALGLISYTELTSSKLVEYHKITDYCIENGIRYFDTAWTYGNGNSEKFLAQVLKKHKDKNLVFSTKIPAKAKLAPNMKLEWVYPENHIINFTNLSLKNLKTDCIPLQQFHLWEDAWANNDEWKNAIFKLKKAGKIQEMGISVNRNQAENCIETLKTGLINSVQVVYNVFEQNPQHLLFDFCTKNNIQIISRAAFENGILTSNFNFESLKLNNNYVSKHFSKTELVDLKMRLNMIQDLLAPNMSMEDMALKFVFQENRINQYLLGMSQIKHIDFAINTYNSKPLDNYLLQKIKTIAWNRNYNYEPKLAHYQKYVLEFRYILSKLLYPNL